MPPVPIDEMEDDEQIVYRSVLKAFAEDLMSSNEGLAELGIEKMLEALEGLCNFGILTLFYSEDPDGLLVAVWDPECGDYAVADIGRAPD